MRKIAVICDNKTKTKDMKNTNTKIDAVIYQEMGQTAPFTVEIEYKTSYSDGYYLTTALELKGRGISKNGDGSDHKRGLKTYRATEKALEKLKNSYNCAYMASL